MKGSHKRLIIAVAVLLVVGVAGSVLWAQAMAGEGAAFGVMKALAFTGGGPMTVAPMQSDDAPQAMAAPPTSCTTGGGCGGEEGASSCGFDASGCATPPGEAAAAPPAESLSPETE